LDALNLQPSVADLCFVSIHLFQRPIISHSSYVYFFSTPQPSLTPSVFFRFLQHRFRAGMEAQCLPLVRSALSLQFQCFQGVIHL
jgi:hypothetical protein